MLKWIENQPVRFLSVAWFVSFILGWLTVLLIHFILGVIFTNNSGNVSPSFLVSLTLFGYSVAGFVSGLATASLIRVHQGEISQTTFNLIVFAWTVTFTVAAMLFFLIATVMFQ